MGMTLKDILILGTDFLKKKGVETPRLDCELMFAHALGLKRLDLYTKYNMPMAEKDLVPLRNALSRRVAGEPVAYIIGKKAFYGLTLDVGPGVLVPQPDTEVLVDKALDFMRKSGTATRVLDLCAGSGAIGLAIAVNNPDSRVTAIEIDDKALGFCSKNIQNLNMNDRIACLKGDLFQPLEAGQKFDVIVSNPPYIKDGDRDGLPAEVRAEPGRALFAGTDGMDIIRRIADEAGAFLNPGGLLCVEIGYADQVVSLIGLLRARGFDKCGQVDDLGHRPRAVSAIRI